MMKTLMNMSFMNTVCKGVLMLSFSGSVRTLTIPKTPKARDAHMKMRVDIFCMREV